MRKTAGRDDLWDAMRGLLCLQVLALHTAAAFWPASTASTAQLGPAFSLLDGHAAVYGFFMLSGLVLSRAWSSVSIPDLPTVAVARTLRLGIPAACAILLAWSAAGALDRPSQTAARVLSSPWLAEYWTTSPTIFRDAVSAILIGYSDASPLARLLASHGFAVPSRLASAPQLWSIAIELQGSLLIALLCAIRHRSHRAGWVATVLAFAALATSPFAPFVLGHAAASISQPRSPGRRSHTTWAAVALLAAGLSLAASAQDGALHGLVVACEAGPWSAGCLSPFQLQKMIGAMIAGIGIALVAPDLRPVPRALSCLGRASVAIYLGHTTAILGFGSLAVTVASICGGPTWLAASVGSLTALAATAGLAVALYPADRLGRRAAAWYTRSASRRSGFSPAIAARFIATYRPAPTLHSGD